MHIYFSGIGGAGIGPLALIAYQAGFTVSGSDKQNSQYTEYLAKNGISLHIGQTSESIALAHQENPIDWLVISSAVPLENPNHPELLFAKENGIKITKRAELLNFILQEKNLQLVAVAGTHGKTTVTAMLIWIFQKLGIPVSYSVGAKTSFADMGHYEKDSTYFLYECDEFDRNFLEFNPIISAIVSIDWDHHDIFETRESYKAAFREFIGQSKQSILFNRDKQYLELGQGKSLTIVDDTSELLGNISLAGLHNRQNALIAATTAQLITQQPINDILKIVSEYPGSERRFEKLAPNVYTDYAHTPEEIAATIQLAKELNEKIVVIYEPLTNKRQHYAKEAYHSIFESVEKVYWLPSYLAREDSNQHVLTPEELIAYLSPKTNATSAMRGNELLELIKQYATQGTLVLCLAGGGGDSLDEYLRTNLVMLTRS